MLNGTFFVIFKHRAVLHQALMTFFLLLEHVGKSRCRVEICPKQIVDLLLRGWRHCSPSIQRYSYAQELVLPGPMGLFQTMRQDLQNQERAP
mgnify:CR=1 FL=1